MTSRATLGAEARAVLVRALLTLAEAGQRPRCADSPQLHLSESAEERVIAAARCHGCPVFTECETASHFEAFGVWAGRDVTVTRAQGAAS